MAESDLTATRLRELVSYEPATGIFIRRVRTAQRHQVGDRADTVITTGARAGYRRIALNSERYHAHRAAWLYVYGFWPANLIDHINGDRGNNRIANLRDVTNSVNLQNVKGSRVDNTSGYLGVTFHKPTGQWRARIQANKKCYHIGMYPTAQDAYNAYLQEKRRVHEGCTI